MSDEDLYADNFAAELLCLRDQSYTLTNDVVLNKDDLSISSTARVVFCTCFFFFLFSFALGSFSALSYSLCRTCCTNGGNNNNNNKTSATA